VSLLRPTPPQSPSSGPQIQNVCSIAVSWLHRKLRQRKLTRGRGSFLKLLAEEVANEPPPKRTKALDAGMSSLTSTDCIRAPKQLNELLFGQGAATSTAPSGSKTADQAPRRVTD
jgi:hypothetical protein